MLQVCCIELQTTWENAVQLTEFGAGMQAQRAELQFSLMVPGKGTVAGALYYFPFQDERETLPAEGAVASQPEPITTYNMTQQPMASQLPTQAPPQSGGTLLTGSAT